MRSAELEQSERKSMAYEDLKLRTRKFALEVVKLVEKLPNDLAGKILGGQLLRAGTSVGANYRSACRARSNADFISKMGIVEEEADETGYWLDLLISAGKLRRESARPLICESGELTAIAVTSINTARKSGGRK
jgi:four helix bundle protein